VSEIFAAVVYVDTSLRGITDVITLFSLTPSASAVYIRALLQLLT